MPVEGRRIDLFLYAFLVMAGGCIYYLFNFVETLDFTKKAGDTFSYRFVWLLLYLMLVFKLAARREAFGYIFFSSGALLAFIAVAALSLITNGVNLDSLSKFAMYLMTMVFAGWLVAYDSVDDIFEAMFRLGIIVLVFHFAMYPVFSSQIDYDSLNRLTVLGTQPYAGLFGHKNLAGSFFGLSALVCVVKFIASREAKKIVYLILAAFHVVTLAATGAAGSLLSFIFALGAAIGIQMVVSRKGHFAFIYWLFLAVLLLIVIFGRSTLLELLGRDEGLTGREYLWAAWEIFFWERPWLGYGYAGFFDPASDGDAARLRAMLQWHSEIAGFDNSYLQAAIEHGIIGSILFGYLLLRGLITTVDYAFAGRSAYKIGPLVLLIFVLVTGLNENSLVLHNHINCVILFWAYLGIEASFLAKSVSREQPRGHLGPTIAANRP